MMQTIRLSLQKDFYTEGFFFLEDSIFLAKKGFHTPLREAFSTLISRNINPLSALL
jgi:hypothetical protein